MNVQPTSDRQRRIDLQRVMGIAIVLVIAATSFTDGAAFVNVEPSGQDQELVAMIRSFVNASSPKEWLEQHADVLTSERLEDVEQLYKDAIMSGAPNLARGGAYLCTLAHLARDERYESLEAFIDYHSVGFMLAETVKEYAGVRASAIDLCSKAESIEASNLAFRAAVLAADSGHFAVKVEADREARVKLQLSTVEDLALASRLAVHHTNDLWFQRFVSLLVSTADQVESEFHLADADEKFKRHLKEITGSVERNVPVDFEFRPPLGDPRKTIGTAHTLAALSYRYGIAPIASARLSVASRAALELHDTELWLWTMLQRYEGDRDAGVSTAALDHLRDAMRAQAESLRSGYRSRAGRIHAGNLSDRIYGSLLGDQLRREHGDQLRREHFVPAELFRAVESLKSRMLLDLMGTEIVPLPAGAITDKAAAFEKLVLGFEEYDGPPGLIMSELRLLSQLAGTEFDRGERHVALTLLEDLYASNNAGFRDSVPSRSLSEVIAALAPDEAIIEYVIPYHWAHPAISMGIVAITRSGVKAVFVPLGDLLKNGLTARIQIDGGAPVDSSPLGDIIVLLRTAIRSSDEKQAEEYLRDLHALLVAPLIDAGVRPQDFKRWILVPHGMLHYVPFAALIDDQDQYLIEHVAITVAPSASVWYGLQESRTASLESFFAVANPPTELARLAYAEREVDAITKLLEDVEATVHKGIAATEGALKVGAAGKTVVHIATHAEFPEDDAMDFHRLRLAADVGNDGLLHAAELRSLDLSSARLVTLSVCNGGLYRVGPADEPYGLIPALIQAGAENVLSTMWPLEDRFGHDYMVEFYQHLANDGPAEANRKACLKFIGEEELIRRWAGFVLVGPGRPFRLD